MKRVERLLTRLSPEQKSYLHNCLKSFSPPLYKDYKIILTTPKITLKNLAKPISWSHMERTLIRFLDWYFHPTHKPPQAEELLKHIRILLHFQLYPDAEKLIHRTWKHIEKTEEWHYGFQLLELQKQLYSQYKRTEKYDSLFALQKRQIQIAKHLAFLQKISWTLEKWWIQGGIILRNPKKRIKVQKWLSHPAFQKPLPVQTPRFQISHLNTLGILYLFNASPQLAYEHFMTAYHLAKTHDLNDIMAIPLVNAIATHTFIHNIHEELKLLETLLNDWKSLHINSPLFFHSLLANILHIVFKYGDLPLATDVYQRAQTIVQHLLYQTPQLSLVYQNLAVLATFLENFSEAFYYCEQAIHSGSRSYHLPFLLLFQAILAFEMEEWSLFESRLRKTYRLLLAQPNPFTLEQFLLKTIREITKKGLSHELISKLEKNYHQLLQQHPYDQYYLQSTQFPFQEWIALKKSNQNFSELLKKRTPDPKLKLTITTLLSYCLDFSKNPKNTSKPD